MGNFNEQISRMKNLMTYGSVNEDKNELKGSMEYHSLGADGKSYGIIRENSKFYIKVAPKSKEKIAEAYEYIGGFNNRKSNEYNSYSNALKQFELKMMSLNEAYSAKVNVETLDPFRKEDVIIEGTKKMKDEIARARQIMNNASALMNESSSISSKNIGTPEAPKTAKFSDGIGAPFNQKATASLDKDFNATAKNPESQGEPFGDSKKCCKCEDAKYVPDGSVANKKPKGNKISRGVKVNEGCESDEWGSCGVPERGKIGSPDGHLMEDDDIAGIANDNFESNDDNLDDVESDSLDDDNIDNETSLDNDDFSDDEELDDDFDDDEDDDFDDDEDDFDDEKEDDDELDSDEDEDDDFESDDEDDFEEDEDDLDSDSDEDDDDFNFEDDFESGENEDFDDEDIEEDFNPEKDANYDDFDFDAADAEEIEDEGDFDDEDDDFDDDEDDDFDDDEDDNFDDDEDDFDDDEDDLDSDSDEDDFDDDEDDDFEDNEDDFEDDEELDSDEDFDDEEDEDLEDDDNLGYNSIPESRKRELRPLIESISKKLSKRINEDGVKLNSFGKHPGYRKKPMTLPQTGSDKEGQNRDWNDESVYNESPFGEKIGSSSPFDNAVDRITNSVMERITKKKR